jgi:hypothetical protein
MQPFSRAPRIGVVCTEMGEGQCDASRSTTRLLVYKQPAVELREHAHGRSAGKSGVYCRDHEAAAMPIGSLPMTREVL